MKRSELLLKIKDAIFDCEDAQTNSNTWRAYYYEDDLLERQIYTYREVREWIKELTMLD